MTDLIARALVLLSLGFTLVPKRRGSKAPAISGWQTARLSRAQLERHLERPDVDGIAVLCGAPSGNIVVLDFDGRAWVEAFVELSPRLPLGAGPMTRTARGRVHVYLRCPDLPEDFTNRRFPKRSLDALVELRGNRSLCVAPPSPGYEWLRHPSENPCPEISFQGVHRTLCEWAGVGEDYAVTTYANGRVSFVLRRDASPPDLKFRLLFSGSRSFRQSWEHRNHRVRDASLSGFDLSLAAIAARAGWRDQEIVDLLIAHRRKWKGDLKLRPDYYGRTLAKARAKKRRVESWRR